MTGVILVRRSVPFSVVIDDLLLIVGASDPEDWINRVEFLPL